MKTIRTTNPHAGRDVCARAWSVQPRAVLDAVVREHKTARDISWGLLGDDEAYETALAEEGGEDATTNFALGIFEHALDWRLGLAVLDSLEACLRAHRRLPKPFDVCATRGGDVFILQASGRPFLVEGKKEETKTA